MSAAAREGADKEDEIEQVAGNAEDEIGEHIKHVREDELLYGDKSLLKVYGPLLVYVCGSPQIYKVLLSYIMHAQLKADDRLIGRDAALRRNPRLCKVPLRLCQVLRTTSHTSLQDPRNLSRP